MKNIQSSLLTLLIAFCAFANVGWTQEISKDLSYQVSKVYPYLSIKKETLHQAESLNDIRNQPNERNLLYDPSWVRKHLSVEISTTHNDKITTTIGQDDVLTQDQKVHLKTADVGADITVLVKYIPENNLADNDPKELTFTFTVDPDQDAHYIGGTAAMNSYLKQQAIDKIPFGSFEGYDLSAVKFTINEDGEVINAHLFEDVYRAHRDEEIDDLLLDAIKNMSCWVPAQYADGTKVSQEFVLTVGNMENCVVSLLNIE